MRRIFFAIVFIIYLQDIALCLQLTQIRVPTHVVRGSTIQLECMYEMGNESLYSVKWYKDGNEFYRFVPRDDPAIQEFELPGISVAVNNSSNNVVVLKSVGLGSTGRYRCEVSAEAPSFQTVSDHADMIVVALPDEGPKITGGRPRYQIGDTVKVNCTSGQSKPPPLLTWFINGETVDTFFLRHYSRSVPGRDELETSVLGLEFRVKQKHFKHGDMKLKCLATIASVYWKINEESVVGDKTIQKTPVLESRGTVSPSSSRADRVQTGSSSSLCLSTSLRSLLFINAIQIVSFLVLQQIIR